MQRNSLIWFFRPTLTVLVCYLVAMGLAQLVTRSQPNDQLDEEMSEIYALADELTDLRKPTPELAPERVAEIQAEALRDSDQRRGALQCIQFASPDNLIVTGPLEKFARIIRGPAFAAFAKAKAINVGNPIFRDGHARVLVTVLTKENINTFVWVLEKQSNNQYADCWMTDGVFPVLANEPYGADEI